MDIDFDRIMSGEMSEEELDKYEREIKDHQSDKELEVGKLLHDVFEENLKGKKLFELMKNTLYVPINNNEHMQLHIGQQNFIRWMISKINQYKGRLEHGRSSHNK